MINKIILLVFSVFFISACKTSNKQRVEVLDLSAGNWCFSELSKKEFFPAEVPGNVFLDLVKNKIIGDPFYGSNEDSVQWVTQKKWVYKTEFELDKVFLNKSNIDIDFDGLDTYAEVYLNDSLILSSQNMYREYHCPCKNLLQEKNILKVIFTPANFINDSKVAKADYKLPDKRGHSRKAPYQFGWDWAPNLPGVGINKPIKLIAYDKCYIKNVYSKVCVSEDCSTAKIIFSTKLFSSDTLPLDLQIKVKDSIWFQKKIFIGKGSKYEVVYLTLNKPKLWWPHDMGESYLYDFDIICKVEGTEIYNSKQRLGVRRVDLIQNEDSVGKSFTLAVNNKPFFAKGANYVPMDQFPSRVKKSDHRRILTDVAKSNMNMLRVWGGGIYENDNFYGLCDSLGIMIWQDFMFACNMYPNDNKFLEEVNKEIREQIIKLNKYASIVLWCGNNEIDEGWHNWGWQKSIPYSSVDSTLAWDNYKRIFNQIIPVNLNFFDGTGRPYWPSSPSIGWGHEESRKRGDAHYWGVWWGEEPFEVYQKKVGRFMTEYGFQAYPDCKTIESVVPSNDRFVGSKSLKSHQKHPRGCELIHKYMERDFWVPANFDDYIYMSQILQAYGISQALESHRRKMPYCMGSLYWQLNDCWPVISWSSIDYYGRWKPLQYRVKEIFSPIFLSLEKFNDKYSYYLINDKLKGDTLDYRVALCSFDGKLVKEWGGNCIAKPNFSKAIWQIQKSELTSFGNLAQMYIKCELFKENKLLTEEKNILLKPNKLEFSSPFPKIKLSFTVKDNGVDLVLENANYTPFIVLSTKSLEAHFSENYFSLEPNHPKRIFIKMDSIPISLEKEIIVKSLPEIKKTI
ncbi:MAG: glycoside hydrolase family 2 protein [Bacteroidales bacterium]